MENKTQAELINIIKELSGKVENLESKLLKYKLKELHDKYEFEQQMNDMAREHELSKL